MSTKGKAKGNTGERKIADFLTGLYGQKFIRVPNSGAFLGGSNRFRKASLDKLQHLKQILFPQAICVNW